MTDERRGRIGPRRRFERGGSRRLARHQLKRAPCSAEPHEHVREAGMFSIIALSTSRTRALFALITV
ncbi:MAG TPA: hypothetical protein VFF43_19965, partial [Caldimonas sp.]|nr:hypothetical protein [Caldimonas sp.]